MAETDLVHWLHITSGNGPVECAWAVAQILPTMREEAGERGIATQVIEAVSGECDGTYRSVLLRLQGDTCAEWAAQWQGTVQWIGRSPFRPRHKRKNWFVGIEVLTPPTSSTQLLERDVVIRAMRASGPGGQHVNKTSSAVRVLHKPTGLTATAQEERSQYLNRKLALSRLAAILAAREQADRSQAEKTRWRQHHDLQRGNPIRVLRAEGPV